MIVRRSFLLRVAGTLGALFVPAVVQAAKHRSDAKPTPTPTPAPAKNETAHLRVWKVTDAPQQALQIRLLPEGKPESAAVSPLAVETQEYQFSEYVDVPAGPAVIEVSTPGQPAVRTPFNLAADGQYTLLVRLQKAQLGIEWMDDQARLGGTACEFRIYNFLPTSGTIQVSLGTVLTVQLASSQSSLRLSGINPAVYPIQMTGTTGDSREIRWNGEVDFTKCRKARLLILTDPYGRVRPRINAS